jgi:hypothetical protein
LLLPLLCTPLPLATLHGSLQLLLPFTLLCLWSNALTSCPALHNDSSSCCCSVGQDCC